MTGVMKKMFTASKSMSGNDFLYDFDPDISIALEYTGSPVNHTSIPKVLPLDISRIPTAKAAVSLALLNHLSLPVVEPVNYKSHSTVNDLKLGSWAAHSGRYSCSDGSDNGYSDGGFDEIESVKEFDENGKNGGKLDEQEGLPKCGYGIIESSGSLGFTSTRDHSHEFSESSDMLETPLDCHESCMSPSNCNSVDESGSTARGLSGVVCYEDEEEESDGEHLECRRKKRKPTVTFCDQDSDEMIGREESLSVDEGVFRERPVPQKPAKRGMCYHCHKGNRFTEKEACLVCDAKFCVHCIIKAMGSMPEGRKCIDCSGFPIDDSKRHLLGRCSRVLRRLLKAEEVKQIMYNEISCPANQLPPECIYVNGSPLCMQELMELRSCSNPPTNLKPGNYWYDRTSGLWGKEGQKPCQIITPQLIVGESKMKRDASNGNTNVQFNNREITKPELWVLQSSGVHCDGALSFWLDADGSYQEEGMNLNKGNLWGKKRTKILCTLLSLPTPESPNPRSRSKRASDGGFPSYLEHRAFCKVLLVGNDKSGTSTIYKQARVLYDVPFSEEELQDIKSMIQSNLYRYLGRLLEQREVFEEESLCIKRKGKFIEQAGPSDSEMGGKSDYSLGPKLKAFSDWLINVIVAGNLEIIFPAATRENAPFVEELWKDASIQATYSRRDEFSLPRAARYFLDRAPEIAQVDYEPSDTDILYAEGITSSNGLKSMEFVFPQTTNNTYKDPDEQPSPVTRCQLVRVDKKCIGEKCKWLEMFEDTNIILFCVSLTEYDEYEFDSNGDLQNRMMQSKKFFESVISHPRFKETNFLLILNKYDLLEEMIEQSPLTRCEWFEDFNPLSSRQQNKRNGSSIAQSAFHHIAAKFKNLFKDLTGRKLYVSRVTGLEADTVDGALIYAREIVKWEEDKLSLSINEFSSESIDVNSSSYSQL
ncbi:extra-large guanine nucleotide-binding protein 1-like isoform X2 [Silene latifolia]|uniref:extra-large guanine nucleotide-binding protein 1-like isoform X2 n=1 Tax=Silene latifolia TaxID=37657 RepID=UPI003D7826DA